VVRRDNLLVRASTKIKTKRGEYDVLEQAFHELEKLALKLADM
jgi:hypothetical protein